MLCTYFSLCPSSLISAWWLLTLSCRLLSCIFLNRWRRRDNKPASPYFLIWFEFL
jgi:hypothetical protein